MIIVDIETSGLNPYKDGMLSIGAVELESGQEFYIECKLTEGREVSQEALLINGFTAEQINNPDLPTDVEAFLYFTRFTQKFEDRILAGHNIGHFDILFLEEIWSRCSDLLPITKTKFPFSYRTVDLHSLAYLKFGASLSHAEICNKLNLPAEPTPHNALEGARSEAAAFRELHRRIFNPKYYNYLTNISHG